MELRVKIDDAFINDLKSKLQGMQFGEITGTRLTQDAFALFKWAVEETSKGRTIVSTDANGEDVKRVVMPALMPKH
jgi:hypothetical protein